MVWGSGQYIMQASQQRLKETIQDFLQITERKPITNSVSSSYIELLTSKMSLCTYYVPDVIKPTNFQIDQLSSQMSCCGPMGEGGEKGGCVYIIHVVALRRNIQNKIDEQRKQCLASWLNFEFIRQVLLKGIVHNFVLYRSNLIFWIVMGCGIADFGRRGL